MAAATRARRPLPRRVYWFRRLLVLGVACALVIGIARLLDWTTDGGGGEQAAVVASTPGPSATPVPGKKQKKTQDGPAERKDEGDDDGKEKLAQPEGRCADEDVVVTPTVKEANAGSPVEIVLELTTVESDACIWEVSPESVFVNIDGEDGTLWSSQQCPAAIPTERVVPRREQAAKVSLWWAGKESDEECSRWTPWVLEGVYTVIAAARGSVTPIPTGFVLGGAVAPTVTETPTPTPDPDDDKDKGKDEDKKNDDGEGAGEENG